MSKRRGFTILETMFAVTVAALVVAAATQMTISVGRGYTRSESQLNIDQRTGLAIQWLTHDLQEAKEFLIISTSRLRIYYPVLEASGTYNRAITDYTNYIEYYRGNQDGQIDPTGTCLIRKPSSSGPHIVTKNLDLLEFTSDNPSSVEVSLRAETENNLGFFTCEMLHRAIFLRNY